MLSLELPNQFRGIGAVESIAKRDDGFLFVEAKKRKFFQNRVNDFFVFFRLQAAGAVNQNAAAFQQRNDFSDDAKLFRGHAREVVWSQAPAEVDAAAHHAGIAARNIDQDSIKRRWAFEGLVFPVVADCAGDLDAEK